MPNTPDAPKAIDAFDEASIDIGLRHLGTYIGRNAPDTLHKYVAPNGKLLLLLQMRDGGFEVLVPLHAGNEIGATIDALRTYAT